MTKIKVSLAVITVNHLRHRREGRGWVEPRVLECGSISFCLPYQLEAEKLLWVKKDFYLMVSWIDKWRDFGKKNTKKTQNKSHLTDVALSYHSEPLKRIIYELTLEVTSEGICH